MCATINKLMEETVVAKASAENLDPLKTLHQIRECVEGKEAIQPSGMRNSWKQVKRTEGDL
jgi:hypothetical protein